MDIQEIIKEYTGAYVNPKSPVFSYTTMMCTTAEQIVYTVMQLTNRSRSEIIKHVQENVISYDDLREFAEYYRELPCSCVCEEIYLMGFESWHKLNNL